jgi:aryl-alcohol dehydrogenase-like predicted oxidoreductase
MQKRELGKSGIKIAPLMFGGNVFGWTVDEKASHALLDHFVAAGFNAIDTANVYSAWVPGHKGGESEAIMGNWLKARGNREHVVVATKVGMQMGDGSKGLKPDYIMRSCEDSLKRLQTDYIDLYQSHTDDADVPIAETLGAYKRLIEQGKVRAIGASNFSAARLSEALAVAKKENLPRYETLQPLYNLTDRSDFEGGSQKVCVDESVSVIPYYSLAAGFLTGKYRSEADFGKSVRGERTVKKYMTERGMRILGALDEVAAGMKAKPAQIAIAWLAARPSIAAPIASATNTAQLDELLAATKITLDASAMKALDAASA